MRVLVSEVPLYLDALFDKDQKAGAAFHELQVSLQGYLVHKKQQPP